MTDRKALKILFDTHWSSTGWKSIGLPPPGDYEYAKAAGYMFDPIAISHDEAIDWLFRSFQKVTKAEVADAFVASLGTRRLEWRSALGSYGTASKFPPHRFTGVDKFCQVCHSLYQQNQRIEDLNVLNFERFKWGGVRHGDPLYAAFDLEQFAIGEKANPTAEDLRLMQQLVTALRQATPIAKIGDLRKMLSTFIKSNKDERDVLVSVLAACNIIQLKDRGTYSIGEKSLNQYFSSFANRHKD